MSQMFIRMMLIGALPLWCIAGLLGGLFRPCSIEKANRVDGRRARSASHHIRASLQPRTVNVTSLPGALPNDTSRFSPMWQREGLVGFGAGTVYMLDLEIGTPKQEISLILDTGSFTMLVDPDCTRAADTSACEEYGYYNTSRSTTSQYLNAYFAAQFGTGYMEGAWYNDTIYIGQDNLPLQHSRIGVNSYSTYLWAGILGVSYGMSWNTAYPTLLDLLVQLGYIDVPIFSLGVGIQGDGSTGQSGEIIFGGVDRWKFRGYLEPIEIWPNPSDQKVLYQQVGYWINLTSFGFTQPGQPEVTLTSDDFARSMLIDSGSTFTYLDADLVSALAKVFNAWIDERGIYFVNCALRSDDGYVNFGFNMGNMVIQVSYADFIVDFETYCALGVQPADIGVATWVLGNSFIRAAYIIFDQMNNAVWLAQYLPCASSGVSDLTSNAGKELWLDFTGLC
ncbi:aspartic peptidase domain-containing protein [Xylariaceae sp. FL1651]|nr:aspartic peptidase domain-containing protein [Xylariaceae sp. FL1651]